MCPCLSHAPCRAALHCTGPQAQSPKPALVRPTALLLLNPLEGSARGHNALPPFSPPFPRPPKVTTEEDLEIIFSRFGAVTACDIIRDYKTGDSLCYGFIGFDNEPSCEEAYFKVRLRGLWAGLHDLWTACHLHWCCHCVLSLCGGLVQGEAALTLVCVATVGVFLAPRWT